MAQFWETKIYHDDLVIPAEQAKVIYSFLTRSATQSVAYDYLGLIRAVRLILDDEKFLFHETKPSAVQNAFDTAWTSFTRFHEMAWPWLVDQNFPVLEYSVSHRQLSAIFSPLLFC